MELSEEQEVDIKESFAWLNGKGLTSLTKSRVMALQEQEVAELRLSEKKYGKKTLMTSCVGCVRKTVRQWHMSCVGVVCSFKQIILRDTLGFEEDILQWYKEDHFEKGIENNGCKLYWDQFETDRAVKVQDKT